ncbi:Major Facilitator Superfamily [Popillia japonica]
MSSFGDNIPNLSTMSSFGDNIPIGVRLLQKLTDSCPRLHFNREWYYRSSVLALTYFAYMSYHLSRKPLSVVKAVLYQNCSQLTPSTDIPPNEINTWCDWAPFVDSDADALLGMLDSAFLFAYAIAMFSVGNAGFSLFICICYCDVRLRIYSRTNQSALFPISRNVTFRHILLPIRNCAERINLRYFLSVGMLLSGIFCYLFGIAKTYNIHNFGYLFFMQAMAGIAQTTGWPGVVTVVGNWFGKSKRGLIFGLWNSHTSIGNILGSVIAGKYVETDWSLSFIIPGFIIGAVGFIIFLFLVVRPTDVGCIPPDRGNQRCNNPYRILENRVANVETPSGDSSETDDTEVLLGEQEIQRRLTERSYLLAKQQQEDSEQAIGFIGACRIPGVIEFSSCLFFSKLVSYTFLYWLPLYVKSSTEMGAALSADFSTLFDVG